MASVVSPYSVLAKVSTDVFATGHEGWRWIFIMEGIMTVLIAIIAYIFLADFPEDAHKTKWFLSSDEIQLVIDRVERDRSDAHVTPFSMKIYFSQARDWKVWCFATNFGLAGLVSYSVSYFLPTILRTSLNFSLVMSLCMTAPCFAFSLIFGFCQAIISDKYNWRCHMVFFNAVMEIVGVAILGFAGPPYARYFGAFLVTAGCNSNVAASVTYMSNNVVGQWKRAFSNALTVAFGALGGIIGTTVNRPSHTTATSFTWYTLLTLL